MFSRTLVILPRSCLLCRGSFVRLSSNFTKTPKLVRLGPKRMGFVKPILFAGAFGIATYATSAIWEYETARSKLRRNGRSTLRGWFDEENGDNRDLYGGPWFKDLATRDPTRQKRGEFRRKANTWWNSLSNGHKTCLAIIAANAAVFVFLRVAILSPSLAPIAQKYFLLSPTSSTLALLNSAFSHYSMLHFGMNMYVLWTLSPFAQVMGQPQFTAFYLTSGVLANVASVFYRQMPFSRLAIASLGASGCLYAVVGALCVRFPNVQFGVPILSDIFPNLHFRAEALWPGLLTFDFLGLLFGFRLFDHVAHMGGLLFGVWYSKWGDKWLWSKRFRYDVISSWQKVRHLVFDD